ncbi:MAG: hypothetical protein ACOC20_06365 [Oceanicaulis sp.]
MNGHFYAFADEQAALDAGALVTDPETGETNAAPGYTRIPGPVWLVEPVLSDPDPETGEQTVTEPGTQSDPVVVLTPQPVAALHDQKIEPAGHQGFA